MFEESKAWIFIVIISILIGAGYGAHYLTSVDSANASLLESKSKLADVHEMLGQRKKAWEATERLIATTRELAEQNNVLSKAKEVLDKRYRAVDADLKYAVDSMRSSVERVRESAPGTEIGDVNLVNGKVLQAAKIRKVEESNISFIHSSGIGTVTVDLLPNEILERFDLGPNALLPQLEAVQSGFLAKPDAAAAVAAVVATPAASRPAAASPPPPSTNEVSEEKLKTIRLKIATLEARIDNYAMTVTRTRETAVQQQRHANDAKSAGKPSTRYTAEANATLAQAQQMDSQLAAMREERKKLLVELEFARNGQ